MRRRHATLRTPIGELLVVADDGGLTGIYFPGHWHPPAGGTLGVEVDARGDALFSRLGVELDEYLAGRRIRFDLPLAPVGDEFQYAVWAMLRDIPFGETVTYGDLAARLGGAVGRNPISILVPCHRVVGADGSLTGYAGGLDRKRRLLELEGAGVVAQRRLF